MPTTVPDDARPSIPFVEVPYTRVFPHPVDAAYEWLTDYQDDDHTKAGAILKRRDVVKRDGNVVVLEGDLEALGRRGTGVAEVHLQPERRRWIARFSGDRAVFEYRLTPTPDGSARLDVRYRIGARRWTRRIVLLLGRRAFLRELDRMWDGFAEAMRKELPAIAPRQ